MILPYFTAQPAISFDVPCQLRWVVRMDDDPGFSLPDDYKQHGWAFPKSGLSRTPPSAEGLYLADFDNPLLNKEQKHGLFTFWKEQAMVFTSYEEAKASEADILAYLRKRYADRKEADKAEETLMQVIKGRDSIHPSTAMSEIIMTMQDATVTTVYAAHKMS